MAQPIWQGGGVGMASPADFSCLTEKSAGASKKYRMVHERAFTAGFWKRLEQPVLVQQFRDALRDLFPADVVRMDEWPCAPHPFWW